MPRQALRYSPLFGWRSGWGTVGRNKPPGPAFGRPDDKLSALRRAISNMLAEVAPPPRAAFAPVRRNALRLLRPTASESQSEINVMAEKSAGSSCRTDGCTVVHIPTIATTSL